MNWFLYDSDLYHEKVKHGEKKKKKELEFAMPQNLSKTPDSYTSWNCQKSSSFFNFSAGIETEH